MRKYRGYNGRSGSPVLKRLIGTLLSLVLAAVLCFGILFGIVVAGERDEIRGDAKIMIVLGCRVMPSGSPSVLLKDRLDKALEWLENHPKTVVVVAGGQGVGEPTSEARTMANYLIARGYPQEQLLLEEQSLNTNENLRLSLQLLAENGYDVTDDIVVVSNGFHLARVRMLWDRLSGGLDNLSTLSAPVSHRPSQLRMHLREPLALVKSFLFDRGV